MDANIRLLALGWEWFTTGEQEPAGMRVISNLTLHIPVRMCKTTGSFVSMSDVDTHGHRKDTCFFVVVVAFCYFKVNKMHYK